MSAAEARLCLKEARAARTLHAFLYLLELARKARARAAERRRARALHRVPRVLMGGFWTSDGDPWSPRRWINEYWLEV